MQFDGCRNPDLLYHKLLFEKAKELVPDANDLYYDVLLEHLGDVLTCMFGTTAPDKMRSRLFVLLTASDRVNPRLCDRSRGQDLAVEWTAVSEMSGRRRKCGGELVAAMVELALKAEMEQIPDKFLVDPVWQRWKTDHEGAVTWEVRAAKYRRRVLSGAFVDAIADGSLR